MLKSLSLVLLLLIGKSSLAFSRETITMLAGESFPPLMWNDNGTPRGVAIEVGKAILEKAGYKVKVQTCPWMRCQIMAEKEGAFITGFSRNAERQKIFHFSDVIMYDDLVIVTKKGKEFSLEDPKQYRGKRIGAQVGVGFGEFDQAKRDGMIIETDVNDVFRVRKILNGRIDGGFFSLGSVGINYSTKLAGIPMSNFTILPTIVSKDPNYLATGKKTPGAEEKIKRINKAIKALTKSGEIERILKKDF